MSGELGIRAWFLEQSGLSDQQVVSGVPGGLNHEVAGAELPLDPAVDADLYRQADYAYKYFSEAGFGVDNSAPAAAEAFVKVYSRDGGPTVAITPAADFAMGIAALAPLLAMGLLDWRPLDQIDPEEPDWKLGVESMREIQRLSIFGDAGKAAAANTTDAGVLEQFRQMAEAAKPLDMASFNEYHHGGKVNQQDRDLLTDARAHATSDGVATPALDELGRRLTA